MEKRTERPEDILAQLPGLYQSDPDRFEELRKELIRQTIESFPTSSQKRAHGIQFQLEARLGKYKDPVVRMNKMVEIFWQQFGLFNAVLQNPDQAIASMKEQETATRVIPFRAGQDNG